MFRILVFCMISTTLDIDLYASWQHHDEYGLSTNRALEKIDTDLKPVVVAVLDSGLEINHPAIKPYVYVNKREIPDNGIDDDNNGKIDDVNGWDFLTNSPLKKDHHYHGTLVSSIIASSPTEKTMGIAPNAILLPLRVVPNEGNETDLNVKLAIDYAVSMGAKIIHCSFGKAFYDKESGLLEALKYWGKKRNIVLVTSSGNSSMNTDRFKNFPGSLKLDNVITVGIGNKSGGMNWMSSYGKETVHLVAPGVNITSLLPDGGFLEESGSSLAAPMLSGSLSILYGLYPELTPAQTQNILKNSVIKKESLFGKIKYEGRLNIFEMIKKAESLLTKKD
ncbi:MAG: S8 family peptidase [Bdellovibrionales bacterium]